MQSHEGGCLCGRVRFQATAQPLDSGYCHCRMCQKNSGAPVVAFVTLPAAGVSWTAGAPGVYESSAHGRRLFCGDCGSFLAFRSEKDPTIVAINTASFDAPAACPPRKHIFTDSRIGWFRTDDRLPCHAGSAD